MKIADVLDKAADLIEPEGAWTQGAEARDANGEELSYPYDDAVCFCAGGAVWKAGHEWSVAISAWRLFQSTVPYEDGPEWNDEPERTQAEVVAKLREAAAKAREQGL